MSGDPEVCDGWGDAFWIVTGLLPVPSARRPPSPWIPATVLVPGNGLPAIGIKVAKRGDRSPLVGKG